MIKMKFFYNQNGIKPFRVAATILFFILVIEIYGILHTPLYEKELEEARRNYYDTLDRCERTITY